MIKQSQPTISVNTWIYRPKIYIDLGLPPRSIYVCRSIHSSCDTVDLMVLCQFSDICGPQGYGFHPIKNMGNCDLDFVAPFNSNFDNKTLCESRVDNSFHYIISYLWKAIFVSYFFFLCIFPTHLCLLISKVSYFFGIYFFCVHISDLLIFTCIESIVFFFCIFLTHLYSLVSNACYLLLSYHNEKPKYYGEQFSGPVG